MALQSMKITADSGSAEVQELRNVLNALLAQIVAAGTFGNLQTAIQTSGNGVYQLVISPDTKLPSGTPQ